MAGWEKSTLLLLTPIAINLVQRRFQVVAALNSALQRQRNDSFAAVNTSSRLGTFGRHYDHRVLWG